MKYLSHQVALNAISQDCMKKQDVRLINVFNNTFDQANKIPKPNSVLFYPSAGIDLITPIILGLPYCTDYYFYEWEAQYLNNNKDKLRCFFSTLNSVQGIKTNKNDWVIEKAEKLLFFNYKGVERTVRWVHKDNKDFLNRDINLTFYFHRGDSYGEGGSGHFWDSDLLPELMKKIPRDRTCYYITDGEPGGLLISVKNNAYMLTIHDGIGGNFYFGALPSFLGNDM